MRTRRLFTIVPALAVLFLLAAVLVVAAQGTPMGAPGSDGPEVAGVEADVTPAFTYQGYLEEGGDPANGSFDFEFRLYDSLAGCCQVGGVATHDGVSVVDGVFTVQLDFGANAFDGAARWLEICVAPAGASCTDLTPRQSLTAAPYAHSLRPGAVISGSVPVDTAALTLRGNAHGLLVSAAGQDGVQVEQAGGSGFSVQETGGNGLFAGTTGQHGALVEYANYSGYAVQFAEDYGVYVAESGIDGVRVSLAGGEGVYVVESAGNALNVALAHQNGLRVQSAVLNGVDVTGDDLAGYFIGDVEITGTCTGCVLANFGLNAGDRPLQVGDVVSLLGVQPSGVDATPLLLLVGPADGPATAVGVVVGGAERVQTAGPRPGEAPERLVPREADSAPPGGYVTIAFSGIVQARVSALDRAIAPGDLLAVGADGAARPLQTRTIEGMLVSEAAPLVGIALEGVDAGQDGLIWLLVDLQ